MTVGHDASAIATRTATTDPFTWTHTPVGAPMCILVFAIHGTSATDHVTAMTYGGQTMFKRVTQTDAAGEPGYVALFVLSKAYTGLDIPTGAQTVSATNGATTDDISYISISLSGAKPVIPFQVFVNGGAADPANPQQAFTQGGGREMMHFAGVYSGQNAAANLALLAGMSAVQSINFAGATFCGRVDRQTTAGTADFTIGWTATAEDTAAIFVAMTEIWDQFPQPAPRQLLAHQ